jgi:IS1 family transposase
LYWFTERKAQTETRENVYLMTMISRDPRQIVSFRVARDKFAWRIQEMIDQSIKAGKYCSDGYRGYAELDYYGAEYVRNTQNKADTPHVESINADLRTFIGGLQRRSRCFFRRMETMEAVVDAFVEAYNAFGEWKAKYKQPTRHRPDNESKHLHHYKDPAV